MKAPLDMDDDEMRKRAHELDATIRVGKHGVESVAEELVDQLKNAEMVKVKFLRAARGGTSTDELAEELADLSGATLYQTRGNTAVYH